MEDDRMYRLGGGGEEEEDGEEEEEEEEEVGKGGGNITTELVLYDDDDDDQEEEEEEEEAEARAPARKKRRGNGNVQSLLEAVIARQQRFFSDLLESMERKEQIREQIRQEREDKWRAEERAQLGVFNNALMALTRELVGDGLLMGSRPPPQQGGGGGGGVPSLAGKSRFKNWKRAEVVQLIKARGEMDSRFAMATKRAELWDELCDRLAAQGIRRDGKQCREKWDKLMAVYKDVVEGKRDQDETPYFAELRNILRRPGTAA